MQTTTTRSDWIKVQGMVCDACVEHVAVALRGVEGVKSVDVRLSEQRAEVVYDPSTVNIARLVAAIEDEGYEASLQG